MLFQDDSTGVLVDTQSGSVLRQLQKATVLSSARSAFLDRQQVSLCVAESTATCFAHRIWLAESPMFKCGLPEKMTAIAVSNDEMYCAAGSASGKIYLWLLTTGVLLRSGLQSHRRAVTSLAFSADDHFVFSGSEDAAIRQWTVADLVDLSIGDNIELPPWKSYETHSLPITALHIPSSPDGRCFSLSADRLCKIFDVSHGMELSSFVLPAVGLCLTTDALERTAFIGCRGGELLVLDLSVGYPKTDSLFHGRVLPAVHSQDIVAVSMAGGRCGPASRCVTASGDGFIKVVDCSSLSIVASHDLRRGPITALHSFFVAQAPSDASPAGFASGSDVSGLLGLSSSSSTTTTTTTSRLMEEGLEAAKGTVYNACVHPNVAPLQKFPVDRSKGLDDLRELDVSAVLSGVAGGGDEMIHFLAELKRLKAEIDKMEATSARTEFAAGPDGCESSEDEDEEEGGGAGAGGDGLPADGRDHADNEDEAGDEDDGDDGGYPDADEDEDALAEVSLAGDSVVDPTLVAHMQRELTGARSAAVASLHSSARLYQECVREIMDLLDPAFALAHAEQQQQQRQGDSRGDGRKANKP